MYTCTVQYGDATFYGIILFIKLIFFIHVMLNCPLRLHISKSNYLISCIFKAWFQGGGVWSKLCIHYLKLKNNSFIDNRGSTAEQPMYTAGLSMHLSGSGCRLTRSCVGYLVHRYHSHPPHWIMYMYTHRTMFTRLNTCTMCTDYILPALYMYMDQYYTWTNTSWTFLIFFFLWFKWCVNSCLEVVHIFNHVSLHFCITCIHKIVL